MFRTDAPGTARAAVCVAYALGAVIHVYFFTQHSEVYRSVADQAVVPFYRDLWQARVVPTLAWSPVAVIAFEASVAVLNAGRGRAVVAANVLAALFQLLLAPLGQWGVINIGLAALHGWLARLAAKGRFAQPLGAS